MKLAAHVDRILEDVMRDVHAKVKTVEEFLQCCPLETDQSPIYVVIGTFQEDKTDFKSAATLLPSWLIFTI